MVMVIVLVVASVMVVVVFGRHGGDNGRINISRDGDISGVDSGGSDGRGGDVGDNGSDR